MINNLEKNISEHKPKMTRTTLFTGVGSGIGGIGGYLLVGALPPLVGCLIGVVAVGGAVLLGHTIFLAMLVLFLYMT